VNKDKISIFTMSSFWYIIYKLCYLSWQ